MSEVRLLSSGIDEFFDRAAVAARHIDKGTQREQQNEIAFESMDLLLTVLTPNKWRLLRALKISGATSIRQLAQALRRDYRGVHSDVGVLLQAGLIAKNDSGQIYIGWDRIVAEMQVTQVA